MAVTQYQELFRWADVELQFCRLKGPCKVEVRYVLWAFSAQLA